MNKNILISKKKDFCYLTIFEKINENISPKDYNIISDYSKLKLIKKYYNNYNKLTKILLYNKDINHKLLYKHYDNITFDINQHNKELSFYFHLDLLINDDNCHLNNYLYGIDFINNIHNINKKENNKIKNIIFSKIILDVIKNYKNFEYYDEYNKKENDILNSIAAENENIIENNVKLIKIPNINISLQIIKEKNINDIYSYLIIVLIQAYEIIDINYISSIFSHLGLKYIDITNEIYTQLNEKIFSNEDFMNKYKIADIKDIFNIEKINFYFILFKYILKNSIYIYNISFLFNVRKKIIQLIKKDSKTIKEHLNNNKNENIDYVLNFILDSEYYLNKRNKESKIAATFIEDEKDQSSCIEENDKIIIKNKENKLLIACDINKNWKKMKKKLKIKNLKEHDKLNDCIIKYSYIKKNIIDANNSFEIFKLNKCNLEINIYNWKKKRRNLSSNKNCISRNIDGNFFFTISRILCKSKFSITNNILKKIVIDEIKICESNITLDLETFIKYTKQSIDNCNLENIKNKKYLSFFNFLVNFIDKVQKEFLFDYKLKLELFFFEEENNITCHYKFYDPINNEEKIFKENNILFNEFNSEIKNQLLSEINNKDYSNIEFYDNKHEIDLDSLDNSFDYIYEHIMQNKNDYNLIVLFKSNEYIPKQFNISNLEYIYHLYDEFYLGYDKKNKKLIIYNNISNIKMKIKREDDLKIYYINPDKIKGKINMIVNESNKIYFFKINLNTLELEKQEEIKYIAEIINNIIIENNEVNYFIYYKNKNINLKEYSIIKEFKNAKKTNLILMLKDDEKTDILVLLNFFGNNVKKIEGYKFKQFPQFLSKIPNKDYENNIIKLIFPCQNKNKKNGIFIIIPYLGESGEMLTEFYKTNEFEVYTICLLSIISINENQKNEYDKTNDNSINNNNELNNIKIKYENNNGITYFLAGGFNTKEKKPMMILYRIKFDEKLFQIIIEPIDVIKLEISDNFKGPITFIHQLKDNNILVINLNGGKQIFCLFIMKSEIKCISHNIY